jgi:hypothetical protein
MASYAQVSRSAIPARSGFSRTAAPSLSTAPRAGLPLPYFQNANWSAEISCLPTCLEPGEKARYAPVLAGPHLMAKFRKSVTL